MDDGGRCLLDVINDPLLLQSFLEDKSEESAKELGSLSSAALENVLLGHQQQQDHVTSTTTNLLLRQSPDSMGFGCDKSVSIAAGDSSPRVAVSSTVPLPPNGQQHPSPHSTAPSPAPPGGSRPHSASPLPPPHTPSPGAWSPQTPGPPPRSGQPASTSKAALPPASRSTVVQLVSSGGTTVRTTSVGVAASPRIIQPKQPQLLPKPAGGNLPPPTQTAPSPRVTTKPPQPAPPPNTVQRAPPVGIGAAPAAAPAAPGPLLIGQPGQPAGVFPAGAQGTFLLNQYIPGIGQSPILIQGSLGQIQGVQLALRPQATGLALPQGHKPHHGQPTLVIPQNLGSRPNIILAPRMVSSPLSFAIAPGQPLTLQQLQAMLPTQHMLAAQPTLGAFAQPTEQQPIVQIPAFTQPQILTQDHHHHHHHHHHVAAAALLPAQPQVSTPGVVVSQALSMQQPVTTPQPVTTASERPKPPPVNLAELLKEHGIMPESDTTPPSSPTPKQEAAPAETSRPSHNCAAGAVPVQPVQVVATQNHEESMSKPALTTTVATSIAPPRQAQLSLAHDGSVILRPSVEPPQAELAPTVGAVSGPASTVLSRTHSALLERLSTAPPVNVPDLATLTAASRPHAISTPLVSPQHLTLHGMNNGLVAAQTLGPPHSFVTVQGAGVAVANVLCHGPATSNAQVNHVVVRHAPVAGHTCHTSIASSGAAAMTSTALPVTAASSAAATEVTSTVKMVVATAHQPVVVPSAPAFVTAAPAPVMQSAQIRPTVTTTTTAVTVVNTPTTANNVLRHTCPKHGGMPLNSQNQLLYEQLQTQIAYLRSVKKPSVQQKLLLQQMLSVEEKIRDSAKGHANSFASAESTPAVTTSAVVHHTHSPKPVVVQAMKHHASPPSVQVKTAAVTAAPTPPHVPQPVAVPRAPITVAVTLPKQQPMVVHKANHVDSNKLPGTARCTTTSTACSTQPVVSGPVVNVAKQSVTPPHPLRVIAPAPNPSATCLPQASNTSCSTSSSTSSGAAASGSHSLPLLSPSGASSTATVPSRPMPASPAHLRVGNQVVKLSPQQQHQLHHAVHHHHLHQHQPRSQTVVLRVQHPTNHVVSPPGSGAAKQILVQVPGVVNKQPVSKSSNAPTSVPPAPVPNKVEVAKPLSQVVEQPKPCPIKPKVPDHFQKLHMLHQRLSEDQHGSLHPDAKSPFASKRDACQRLLRYHVFNTRLAPEQELGKSDEIFAAVSERLLKERRRLYEKFQYLMLLESMRDCSTAEKIMVEKLFIQHESEALAEEKRAAEEAQYLDLPVVDSWPTKSPSTAGSPESQCSRTFKKEPPDRWFDDGADLEPAAKRRSIKEEDEEEDDPTAPQDDDLMSSIRKELDMSPSDDDEFVAGGLADFEPPMVRFASPESKRTMAAAAAVVADWTTKASGLPKAPELDLSGIEGLDDDDEDDSRASSAGVLGLGGYGGSRVPFGDDDDDDDDVGGELHTQVQSAINSILDFRGGDELGGDGGNRGEPMDYETADDEAPTDSALDEAVRSILL